VAGDTLTLDFQAQQYGTATLTVTATSGVNTVSDTFIVTITNVNDLPVVRDLICSGDEDNAIEITLVGIDEDLDDLLTSSVVSLPSHGSVIVSGEMLVYTPDINFNGSDSFTFKVNDGTVDSNTASVDITVNSVNDVPVVGDDSAITDEDTAVMITLMASDVDSDVLTYEIVDIPSNGTLSGVGTTFQYMPNSEFSGTDYFTFKVFDSNAESRLATVSINVNNTNETQWITLKKGWNLVSLYTQPVDIKPASVFRGHFDVIKEIRTLNGVYNTSWPSFISTLQEFDLAGGYWIKSIAARSDIKVSGSKPTSTQINLKKGWNLIGFPSVGAQDTRTVFKPLSDKKVIDRIVGTSEFYTFDSNALVNSLSSLKPGDGYWVKMLEADTLTVTSVEADNAQNGGRTLAKSGGETKLAELNQKLVTYPSVPAICVSEVKTGGRRAPTGSLLAAYVGDELCGVQEFRYQDGKMIVPLVIQSSQLAEVRFRLWHSKLAKWFEIVERIQIDSGDVLGMGDKLVLNISDPWTRIPELVLRLDPLRLLVRHELNKQYVVEQSRNLNKWEQRWQLNGTGRWREILIPAADTQKYFRIKAIE
jgi:hypothetical protein